MTGITFKNYRNIKTTLLHGEIMYALHFTLYTSVFANIYPTNTILAKIISCKEQGKELQMKSD